MSLRFPVISASLLAASCVHHADATLPSAFTANQPLTPIPTTAAPMTVTASNGPFGAWVERRTIAAIKNEQVGWYTFELAPNGDVLPLQLEIGTTAPLIFKVGDSIAVRGKHVALGATSSDISIAFVDADGPLAGSFTDHADLDGWVLARVGVEPCTIGVEHGGARIVIPPHGWYTLRAADGVFAVSAACARPAIAPAPGQPPTADYVPDSNVVQFSRLLKQVSDAHH